VNVDDDLGWLRRVIFWIFAEVSEECELTWRSNPEAHWYHCLVLIDYYVWVQALLRGGCLVSVRLLLHVGGCIPQRLIDITSQVTGLIQSAGAIRSRGLGFLIIQIPCGMLCRLQNVPMSRPDTRSPGMCPTCSPITLHACPANSWRRSYTWPFWRPCAFSILYKYNMCLKIST
jgi:hypothetical protein